jgi:hypothetical protein
MGGEMHEFRMLLRGSLLATLLVFAAPSEEIRAEAAPTSDAVECEAWYVGTVGDEEYYYFECYDDDGSVTYGWMIWPVVD